MTTTRTRRAPAGHRACRDCSHIYPLTDQHRHPSWCPSCLATHERVCRSCRALFPREADQPLCPACRRQRTLF